MMGDRLRPFPGTKHTAAPQFTPGRFFGHILVAAKYLRSTSQRSTGCDDRSDSQFRALGTRPGNHNDQSHDLLGVYKATDVNHLTSFGPNNDTAMLGRAP
jgi:hypothetical protein